MVVYLVVCLFAFFWVYLLIPVCRRWADKMGIVDRPNARKIHHTPIPLSGGMAVFIGTILTLLLFFQMNSLYLVLIVGGFILFLTGLLDDWYKSKGKDFPALPKLLIQIGVAVYAYKMGIEFFGIRNFWDGGGIFLFPEWLVVASTVIWITGFINMINFLDGMDGLAGGITTISSLCLFLIAILKAQADVAALTAVLIGASLAFLRHNFPPATIFLGDAGSMFIGFVLGITSLYGMMKSATLLTLIVIILALGVPVVDTIQVIVTRLRAGTPVYKPDKRHVHHRLLRLGLSPRQAVMVMYAMGVGLSLLSLFLLLSIS